MKTLKKFSTHEQYINYLVNNVTDIDFISICDDERIYQFHSLMNKGKLIEYINDSYSSTADLRCYIDTGLIPDDNNWKFEAILKVINYSVPGTWNMIFGTYNGEEYNTYRVIRNNSSTTGSLIINANTKAGGGGSGGTIAPNLKVKVTLYYKKFISVNIATGTNISNVTLGTNSGTKLTNHMILGRSTGCPSCWYSFDSYYNNELVQALRPFKRYSDGRRGMIDLLTGQEFYSLSNNEYQGSE